MVGPQNLFESVIRYGTSMYHFFNTPSTGPTQLLIELLTCFCNHSLLSKSAFYDIELFCIAGFDSVTVVFTAFDACLPVSKCTSHSAISEAANESQIGGEISRCSVKDSGMAEVAITCYLDLWLRNIVYSGKLSILWTRPAYLSKTDHSCLELATSVTDNNHQPVCPTRFSNVN